MVVHQEGLLPAIAKDIKRIRDLAHDIIKGGNTINALEIRDTTLELEIKFEKLIMDEVRMFREIKQENVE